MYIFNSTSIMMHHEEQASVMQSIEIDQDLAKRLLVDGGTFFFQGVPKETEFGIDMKCWNTGDKFKGIKMIPPGLHFIHYSATNKYTDVSPRTGFIHYFKKSEFLVKKWNSDIEGISDEDVPEDEVARYKDNLLNLDPYLGVYPFDIYIKWKDLTEFITEELVKRLVPLSGQIRSALELRVCDKPEKKNRRSRPSTLEEKEDDLLPNLQPKPGTELRLTPFPTKDYPDGSSPSEITKHFLDPTFALDQMLSTYSKQLDFVGELQFVFICFLVGHCLEALDQWKKMVKLMCSCQVAVIRRTQLYSAFITALEVQLEEIPEDFLVDIVASNNIVYRSLRDLFRTVQTIDEVDGRLRSKMDRFQEKLTQIFEWDFSNLEQEEDDEAPVIVNL